MSSQYRAPTVPGATRRIYWKRLPNNAVATAYDPVCITISTPPPPAVTPIPTHLVQRLADISSEYAAIVEQVLVHGAPLDAAIRNIAGVSSKTFKKRKMIAEALLVDENGFAKKISLDPKQTVDTCYHVSSAILLSSKSRLRELVASGRILPN